MKKITAAVLCLVLAVLLAGCGKYVSSYKAVGFVHSNEKASAFMSFISFDGTMVFKLKCRNESVLKFTAKLETGNIKAHGDCNGTETELFSLQSGDEVDSEYRNIVSGTVYIIVKTDGDCRNGDIRFSLE